MKFAALREQAFTALLTAASKNGASLFGRHPGAEAKLLLTGPLGRLVGAFHNPEICGSETLPDSRRIVKADLDEM